MYEHAPRRHLSIRLSSITPSTAAMHECASPLLANVTYALHVGPCGEFALYRLFLLITTLTILPYCPKYSYRRSACAANAVANGAHSAKARGLAERADRLIYRSIAQARVGR